MHARVASTLLASLLLAVGCSSSSETTTPSTQDTGVSTTDDSASTGDTAEETAAEAGHEMKAPTITMVMKMDGALHVMWKNNETGCDSVEGERKTDTEAYKVVFTVPGSVDNKMDVTATADTTYTYRLRCKMGADYSPYSNEMSKNPVK